MKVAVIGAGIAGLSAARWLTLGGAEVHVFEREARIGGHTRTVTLADGRMVDTGFIVHNRVNYPGFVALMDELGVPTAPSDMSFAYAGPELSWCSRGLNGLLTERRHALSPRFWRFWREVARFNAWGRALARDPVVTADMNTFAPAGTFDRVVSVEMFEHMRNHRELMRRISTWLVPGGRLFVHIFTHRELSYLFEPKDAGDWMSREFFSGGIMPADTLLLRHQEHLRLEDHWRVDGAHYQRTAEAWLQNLDVHRAEILDLFRRTYGPDQAAARFHRWRVFVMAYAELWGWRGQDWLVSHYRFLKPGICP